MAGIDPKQKEQNRKIAYDYYISQGLTPIQASALIGNFEQESGLNPGVWGDNGTSKGIAQWRGNRLQKLRDTHGGENSGLFNNQAIFALQELKSPQYKKAYDRLKNAKTIEEATLAISEDFEKPNKKFANNENRIRYAVNTHNKFNPDNRLTSNYKDISYANSVAPYINQSITPNIINFDNSSEGITFDGTEQQDNKEQLQEDPKVAEAKNILAQKQNEQQFLEELFANQEQQIQQQFEQPEVQQQEEPTKDITQTFAEVSNFIDNPLLQQGGLTEENKKLLDRLFQQKNKPITQYNKTTDTYIAPQLDEVQIKSKPKGFWKQSIDQYTKEHKDDGLLEAIGSVVTYPIGIPQQAMMYGLTGKVQKPSEAMGSNNAVESAVMNTVADPANLLFGEVLNGGKNIAKINNERALGNIYGKQFQTPSIKTWGQINSEKYVAGLKPKTDLTLSEDLVPSMSKREEVKYTPYREDGYINWFDEQRERLNPIKVKGDERSKLRSSSIIDIRDFKQQGGSLPISSNGVYDYPAQNVIVPTKDGRITMNQVNYPILGIDEFGNKQMMLPNGEYKFRGKTIVEYPQITEKEKQFLKEISKLR